MGFRLPDTNAERGENADDPTGFERPGDDLTPTELKRAIRDYAETVDIDVPLDEVEIQISKRLKRAAGKAGRKNGDLFMRFAWKAYQSWGWNDDFEGTIRHELVHIWEYVEHGKGGHGRRFKSKAREVDAPRHCPSFAQDDARWFLICGHCGKKSPRFKRSKVVKNPEPYRSACCGASITVRDA
nr:hypothetical protein 22 [bacterium]